MKVFKFVFSGAFNSVGVEEVNAPDEAMACKIFFGIDHGTGWGIADDRSVDSIDQDGIAYEFDGNQEEWLEAVRMGEAD